MYKRAVEIAHGVETSDASLHEMKAPQKPVTIKTEPVNQVKRERRDQPLKPAGRLIACLRCGKEGYTASVYRFKDKYCNYYRKKGHITRVCRRRLQQVNVKKTKTRKEGAPPRR